MTTKAKKHEHMEYVGLLKTIFDFLLTYGADVKTVRTIIDRAFSETVERNRTTYQGKDSALSTAARVLDAWHRNPRYLDANAEPRAIPLLGKAPSVEALVRSENPRCNTGDFARRLKTLRLLAPSGRHRYKPAARIAVVTGFNPLIKQYVARSSATLLRTITHNVKRAAGSTRLIERFAEVPDLPVRFTADFRKFSNEQGWAMLKTLNDWLESRRARRTPATSRRTVRAGVHLYAYVDSARPNGRP